MQILLKTIDAFLWLMNIAIAVRCVLSWFPGGEGSRIGRWFVAFTEPVLGPIRRLLMRFEFARSVPIDFSPIVAWLLLIILQRIIDVVFYLFLI